MKVIDREFEINGGESFVTYKFDTGHELRQWYSGHAFGYTPKGNYTSLPTMHKLARIASEFEDTRLQVQG
jgi:hypothetical protein